MINVAGMMAVDNGKEALILQDGLGVLRVVDFSGWCRYNVCGGWYRSTNIG